MAHAHGGKPAQQKRLSGRAARMLLVIGILLIAAIFGYGRYRVWKNNGSRYAAKLGAQLGAAQAAAEKAAGLKLTTGSAYSSVNAIAAEYTGLYESRSTVQVFGTTVPEWVIFAGCDGENLYKVVYYNYKLLGANGNGKKLASPVATDGIMMSMDQKSVQAEIGFQPVRISYEAGTVQEVYKYYTKDSETGSQTVYLLTVNYEDGHAVSVEPHEDLTLLTVLTP